MECHPLYDYSHCPESDQRNYAIFYRVVSAPHMCVVVAYLLLGATIVKSGLGWKKAQRAGSILWVGTISAGVCGALHSISLYHPDPIMGKIFTKLCITAYYDMLLMSFFALLLRWLHIIVLLRWEEKNIRRMDVCIALVMVMTWIINIILDILILSEKNQDYWLGVQLIFWAISSLVDGLVIGIAAMILYHSLRLRHEEGKPSPPLRQVIFIGTFIIIGGIFYTAIYIIMLITTLPPIVRLGVYSLFSVADAVGAILFWSLVRRDLC